MVNEEKFFAWLDGELESGEAAEVEAQVAADPDLQRRAAEHRALASRLSGAFATVAAAPVPERLLNAAGEDGLRVVSFATARERRAARRSLPLWQQAAAMAATLALGIAAGNMLMTGPSSPIATEDGRLVASADLEAALYSQLASAPVEGEPRIGLTFRDRSGSICRTFTDDEASGLACREGGDWRIRALFQGGEGQAGDYRMASGGDPRLLEIVDSTISGEPLDAAQEKASRERGWR